MHIYVDLVIYLFIIYLFTYLFIYLFIYMVQLQYIFGHWEMH